MSSTNADLIVRLRNARQARRDAQDVAGGVRAIGVAAKGASAAASASGKQISSSLSTAAAGARRGAFAVGVLTAAGAKMGLTFDSQVESAQMRFRVFTDDVDGLTNSIKLIDRESQFNFGDLANEGALLGNFGVNAARIPSLLRGIANAAAASGQGSMGLQRISLDLGQIQSQGKVTGDELRDLAQAGAPVNDILRKTFHLTDKQMANVGANGLSATKFLRAVTNEWNSGRMAGAAQRQLQTIGGQWALFTGNAQRLSGAATAGLTAGLEHDVLPAANRAVEQITDILGTKGLSDKDKLRQSREVIRRELGPVAQDLIADIKRADLPSKLDHEFELALNKMSASAVHNAPHLVSNFVNAWLGAGPWAKLISGAWFARKLGIDKGVLAALKAAKGGGAGGTLAGLAKAGKPIPVFVTNSGFGGGGPSGGPWTNDPSRKPYTRPMPASRGSRVRSALGTTGRRVGELAVAGSLYEGYLSLGHALGLGNGQQTFTPPDFSDPKWKTSAADHAAAAAQFSNLGDGSGVGLTQAQVNARAGVRSAGRSAPVAASSRPIVIHHTTQLVLPNGRVLAEVVDTSVANEKARR
jgi:tape measure domain-containing protein